MSKEQAIISDSYNDRSRITLESFRPEYAAEAGELVVSIQREEFGVAIRLEDQPDLLDVPRYYQKGLGQFWCAVHDGRVVGTLGLLDIGHEAVALRKMFVRKEFRGGGADSIAQRLLQQAEAWCIQNGIREVLLGTIDHYAAARRFYERNGFCQLGSEELPTYFPRMKVDNTFYRKVLLID